MSKEPKRIPNTRPYMDMGVSKICMFINAINSTTDWTKAVNHAFYKARRTNKPYRAISIGGLWRSEVAKEELPLPTNMFIDVYPDGKMYSRA